MAIRDLLWACPLCKREGGLIPHRRAERCEGCHARFRRGRGATIIAYPPEGEAVSRHAAEWSAALPPLDLETRTPPVPSDPSILHTEPVAVRFVESFAPVRHRGRYLNRVERFGRPHSGTLTITRHDLQLERKDQEIVTWPFEAIRAVQPSSSTLQLRAKDRRLASFRFPKGSTRFWEEILIAALRSYYRENQLGEIIELQPRIVTR